jgi:hypothetical protein
MVINHPELLKMGFQIGKDHLEKSYIEMKRNILYLNPAISAKKLIR